MSWLGQWHHSSPTHPAWTRLHVREHTNGHASTTYSHLGVYVCVCMHVQAGEIVIRQAEPGDCFYVVEAGQFDVFVQHETDPPLHVHTYTTTGGQTVRHTTRAARGRGRGWGCTHCSVQGTELCHHTCVLLEVEGGGPVVGHTSLAPLEVRSQQQHAQQCSAAQRGACGACCSTVGFAWLRTRHAGP